MSLSQMPLEIPGYKITELLYAGSRTIVYQAMEESTQRSIILKLLQQDYPSFNDLLQFRNQYTIAKNLNFPGVVRPYHLETYGNRYVLVLEDFGGIALRQYSQEHKLSLLEILAIALQLAEILHELSQHRVIHKDIKPANILIHPESKQIQLIDFSIATLLPRETQEIKSLNVLEGTLAYLAPEQTGRMNRGVDYRSDFYALGVTLYELLTEQLPFQADNPLELVHCHLAKTAIAPHLIKPEIPVLISDLVLKLMAKNAEDRYQSALGLKFDLEQCLDQLKTTGVIEPFVLGERDISDRFLIPEKLYGRETEVETLLATFDKVANGSSELMLVAGFSGIGKTAVIHEVHKPIVRQQGYFIKGKFDQFQRNIPFSAFVQAFRDLMGQLLSESDAQLTSWKSKILEAVGENGQVIIDVIPELEKIIGKQPAVIELSGSAAQNRFNLLFQRFIQIFTTPEHPLVVFLDDLQWADLASLNLLKLLMGEARVQYLFILGAYRDNEVFAAHPLMMTLDQIQKVRAIHTIELTPLTESTINQLVANTLSCHDEIAQPLTQLVYQKTQGNPFFTTQFLNALHNENWIQFHPDLGYWHCDLTTVRQLTLTDDVVEFMAIQLQKLPQATQQALKLAACIGNQFDLKTLAIVSEQSEADTAVALWSALQAGLILPIGNFYRFFQSEIKPTSEIAVHYKFLHDRIQQAAYSLIPDNQKQATHLRIGQFLLKHTALIEEKLFEIVSQFNLGLDQVTNQHDRDQIARLNLSAARKARLSAAYAACADYCDMGLKFAGDVWQNQPDFALELYIEATNAAYLTGAFETVDRNIEFICQQTSDPLEQVKVLTIQIQALIAQSQLSEAIATGRNILKVLGVELPEHPTPEMMQPALASIRQQLAEIPDVVNLTVMSDPAKLAAMNILSSMTSAAYIGSPTLYPLIVLKLVELSIEFGNAVESPYAYATYGLILCAFGNDIVAGNRGGDIGLALMEKFQAVQFEAKILNLVYSFTRIWQAPLQTILDPLHKGYQSGLESGDLEFAAYCAYNRCQTAFVAGNDLLQLQIEMQQYGDAIAQLKQTTALNFHQIGQQAVLNWLGETENPKNLIGTVYDETIRVPEHQAAGDACSIALFYIHKLILTYHFGTVEEAFTLLKDAKAASSGSIGTTIYSLFYFYHALTLLARSDQNQMEAVNQDLDRLIAWAVHAPTNFTHRCELIQAEQQRVLGNRAEAIDLYDCAIASAKANGYLQDEALANELAAKFYLNWGKEKVAAGYLQESYYCYSLWGAKAKITQLEQHYPQLLAAILHSTCTGLPIESTTTYPMQSSRPSSSSSTQRTWLDFPAVLKAAQAISQEIELENLLDTLMQTAIANAGAEVGYLLIQQDSNWMIAASHQHQTELVKIPLIESQDTLPQHLIYFVARTQEIAVFDNLSTVDQFMSDRYVITHQPKSVLCAPIIWQGKLISILYLENNITIGAFTSDRVETLSLLMAQAAISIENAQLYQQLEDYSETLEEEVARKTEALSQKAMDLEQTLQNLQQTQVQLIQSEKMSALGQLVAGIAHEINNPVNFIYGNLGYTETYVKELLSLIQLYQQEYPQHTPVIQERIEEIDLEFLEVDLLKTLRSMSVGSDRIRQIVLSLRNFSRLDEAEMKAVDIHEGIDSTLLLLQNRFDSSVQIIKIYSTLPKVTCYASEMNQVFLGVISNALDAVQTIQNATIHIQTERIEDFVSIKISDNGHGIPQEIHARIFDPFFTTKPIGSGTGLGLSVSYTIIKKHGGTLICDTTVSQGAKFIIEIPIQPLANLGHSKSEI